MKLVNRRIALLIVLTFLLIAAPISVMVGQVPPPPPPPDGGNNNGHGMGGNQGAPQGMPIDGGLGITFALALYYVAKKLRPVSDEQE